MRIAFPAIFNNVVRMLMEVVNLSIIGQLGRPSLVAGVGMGNMTINMIGFSFIIGFNSVLDTLISQSAGARKLELCGVFRNRGIFFVCIIFMPISIILNYSEDILVYIGQHKEVASHSQRYINAFLPGLFLNSIGDCQLRFLNNLGKTEISFYCSAIGVGLHLVCSYVFIIWMDMELWGTGLSLFIAYFAMLALMLWYASNQ